MVLCIIGLIGSFFTYLGFGTIGITAGSWAAYLQSLIEPVSSGSIFSIFQSWGMKGVFENMSWIGDLGINFNLILRKLFMTGWIEDFFKFFL